MGLQGSLHWSFHIVKGDFLIGIFPGVLGGDVHECWGQNMAARSFEVASRAFEAGCGNVSWLHWCASLDAASRDGVKTLNHQKYILDVGQKIHSNPKLCGQLWFQEELLAPIPLFHLLLGNEFTLHNKLCWSHLALDDLNFCYEGFLRWEMSLFGK